MVEAIYLAIYIFISMSYRAADLNLLKVFEALMTERNVTRAAQKLSLTQPTVSNALSRLRETFDDPLFVRQGAGIQPTQRALDLWGPLSSSLQSIRGALDGNSFDASNSTAELRIGMADYTASVVMPRLINRLKEVAPHMKVRVLSGMPTEMPKLMIEGSMDFVISAYHEQISRPSYLRSRILWVATYPCFMSESHPFAKLKNIPLDKFLSARHVDVNASGDLYTVYERQLQSLGLQRNTTSMVMHFATAFEMIRNSDLIGVLPWAQGLELRTQAGLVRKQPPVVAAPRNIELLWHERNDTSPLQQMMRSLILELFESQPKSL